MKQKMKLLNPTNTPSPLRIKGHMKVTLTNAKTGEQEVIEKDNMQTNGIAEYLTNLGWMNSDNLTKSNLVKELLGGILVFDDAITEDANIVKAPGGLHMVANGACEVANGQAEGDPTEMGSWVQESETGSGWKDDGTYHLIWEWGLGQGNGKIASACLTSKEWGHSGEGNSKSDTRKPTSVDLTKFGSSSEYTIMGVPCRLDVEDSSVYGIEFDVTNYTATIRKYRLPLTKANLKGTPTAPIVLSESTINIPQELAGLIAIHGGYEIGATIQNECIQDADGILHILANNNGHYEGNEWGNGYTQKLWEIDPVAETCVESTLPNLYSGDRTMYGMYHPVWLDKDTVMWRNGYDAYNSWAESDIVYSMKRTSGTWGNFQQCPNTSDCTSVAFKWKGKKAFMQGAYPNYIASVFDFDTNTCCQTNALNMGSIGSTIPTATAHDKPLVIYVPNGNNDAQEYTIKVLRDLSYIATIWNAQTPYQKTSEKFMRIEYVLTFVDEEEETT